MRSNIFIGIAIFLLGCLLLSTIKLVVEKEDFRYEDYPSFERQTILKNSAKDLENLKIVENTRHDSIAETIRCNQLMIIRQQEILLNDFRQEMNNNINKMNTWLAFAIGIISIIGVFIPVVLQLKFSHDERITLDSIREKSDKAASDLDLSKTNLRIGLESKFQEFESDYNKKIVSAIQNLESAKTNITNDYKKLKDDNHNKMLEWEQQAQLQQLWSNFLSFNFGCEDNIIKNQPERDNLTKLIWNKISESFDDIVKTCCSSDELVESNRMKLIVSLIMMLSLSNRMKNSPSKSKYRFFDQISDSIRPLLIELTETIANKAVMDTIKKSLFDLNQKIQRLSF